MDTRRERKKIINFIMLSQIAIPLETQFRHYTYLADLVKRTYLTGFVAMSRDKDSCKSRGFEIHV